MTFLQWLHQYQHLWRTNAHQLNPIVQAQYHWEYAADISFILIFIFVALVFGMVIYDWLFSSARDKEIHYSRKDIGITVGVAVSWFLGATTVFLLACYQSPRLAIKSDRIENAAACQLTPLRSAASTIDLNRSHIHTITELEMPPMSSDSPVLLINARANLSQHTITSAAHGMLIQWDYLGDQPTVTVTRLSKGEQIRISALGAAITGVKPLTAQQFRHKLAHIITNDQQMLRNPDRRIQP